MLNCISALWAKDNTAPFWNGSIATAIVNEGGGDGSTSGHAIRIATPAELVYLAQQVNNYDTHLRLKNSVLHRNAGGMIIDDQPALIRTDYTG